MPKKIKKFDGKIKKKQLKKFRLAKKICKVLGNDLSFLTYNPKVKAQIWKKILEDPVGRDVVIKHLLNNLTQKAQK